MQSLPSGLEIIKILSSIVLTLMLVASWIMLVLGVGSLLYPPTANASWKAVTLLGVGAAGSLGSAFGIARLVARRRVWTSFFALLVPGVLCIGAIFLRPASAELGAAVALLVGGAISLAVVNLPRSK